MKTKLIINVYIFYSFDTFKEINILGQFALIKLIIRRGIILLL